MKPYLERYIADLSRERLRRRMLEVVRAHSHLRGYVPESAQRLYYLAVKKESFRAEHPCLSPWEMVDVLRETIGVPFPPKRWRTAQDDFDERYLLDPTVPYPFPPRWEGTWEELIAACHAWKPPTADSEPASAPSMSPAPPMLPAVPRPPRCEAGG